jgi:hypothetical protein
MDNEADLAARKWVARINGGMLVLAAPILVRQVLTEQDAILWQRFVTAEFLFLVWVVPGMLMYWWGWQKNDPPGETFHF